MARRMNVAWALAVGAGIVIVAAQAHGAATQKPAAVTPKPVTTQKTVAPQKPIARKAAPAPKVPTTTLTGCLKMDGDQYQLTNVEGSKVEKGRSWKTGFVKKTAKNVDVVGASSSVKLKDQVGRQVSVVGTKDGETHLKASSIKRVAASCT